MLEAYIEYRLRCGEFETSTMPIGDDKNLLHKASERAKEYDKTREHARQIVTIWHISVRQPSD